MDPARAGAGGVGGLLAVTRHDRGVREAETFWATWDLNGNVIGLRSTSTTRSAVYEYDAFGQPLRVNEPEEGLNPIRFSSKYVDAETGMSYYGYRYYSPELGRWLNRDPIGEKGGMNLYGMCRNDPVNRFDVLGKYSWAAIIGTLLEAAGLTYDAIKTGPAIDDTIIDSYGGPEGFLDATERELAQQERVSKKGSGGDS